MADLDIKKRKTTKTAKSSSSSKVSKKKTPSTTNSKKANQKKKVSVTKNKITNQNDILTIKTNANKEETSLSNIQDDDLGNYQTSNINKVSTSDLSDDVIVDTTYPIKEKTIPISLANDDSIVDNNYENEGFIDHLLNILGPNDKKVEKDDDAKEIINHENNNKVGLITNILSILDNEDEVIEDKNIDDEVIEDKNIDDEVIKTDDTPINENEANKEIDIEITNIETVDLGENKEDTDDKRIVQPIIEAKNNDEEANNLHQEDLSNSNTFFKNFLNKYYTNHIETPNNDDSIDKFNQEYTQYKNVDDKTKEILIYKDELGMDQNEAEALVAYEQRYQKRRKHRFLKFSLKLAFYVLLFAAIILASYVVVLKMSDRGIAEDGDNMQIDKIRTWYLLPNEEFSIISYDLAGGVNNPNNLTNKEKLATDNINNAMNYLKEYDPGFLLLQEIDKSSSRSKKVDETELISKIMINYSKIYTPNYKTMYKFWPIPNFTGMLNSGLYTVSQYHVNGNARYVLPHTEAFPEKYFAKDTCVSIAYLPVIRSEHMLLIVNIDMSDYDDGDLWNKQFNYLKELLQEEKEKGSYIIIGGNFQANLFDSSNGTKPNNDEPSIDASNMWEGYSLIIPSNADTLYTVIEPNNKSIKNGLIEDGFIVSDNIKASAEILDSNFEYSNHNPVKLTFILE